MYIEGITYLERIITMSYLIIYFREDLEKFLNNNFIHQKKCWSSNCYSINNLWISSDRNYDKLVAILCHKYKSKRSIQAGIFTSL